MVKEISYIKLSEIDATATDLQIRCENDPDQIDNIKEALAAGEKLPPIVLFYDKSDKKYYIGDGWHRYYAYRETKSKDSILAEVRNGTRQSAMVYALGANANHGLRRTNADKRNAVEIALKSHNAIFETNKIKNVAVAELCKVAESFVRKIRKEQAETSIKPEPKSEQKFAQCDFFAELDATCKQFSETFKQALNHTYFLSEDISKEDKIQTINAMERDLKKHHQSLRDLKAKLQDQEPEALDELVDTAETLLI